MLPIDSERLRGDPFDLKFKEALLKDTLVFKTEYNTYLNIFCGDEFKKMVEMAGLTELLFKEDLASIF